jgi:DNA replicative helicase MCM subunit Mcm2 (Cdc46/Mcm family)
MAEAYAKIRFSVKVEVIDVKNAIDMLEICMEAFARLKEGGDRDVLQAEGRGTKKSRDLRNAVFKTIDTLVKKMGMKTVPETEVIAGLLVLEYDKYKIKDILDKMSFDGELLRPISGMIRTVNN